MKRRPLFSSRSEPHADGAAWYKDAIIYEVRVRSFFDSDSDGLGDFRGLTEKLDYLQDLGVTALWLLPFYPSPLRDDGYDISDYTDVHPEVGTIADLKSFLAEAHARGLRVITELVLNHTSDQHPWFQRARRAPPGSPERDFYVWSDSAEIYREARIIFKDFEPSNWAWDPIARAYYWHRFYAHQPDLNFDNPAVQKALLEVVDFWFDIGVDGLRLDAVPYLYEREGTNCENLKETHAFLKLLRRHVDERYKDRMLLAEANQWPEDSVAYFGEGDECHMAFHFPIMPRLFMSIHLEDRFPLVDILAQTPALPENCQWALFLRNHDELTLEMVTDEERDYMYSAYARERAMRINLGIRRRLAPLLANDRRNIELMNGLLFSLPGTPVLYYGDEIGMGDNVYLGDRNGVRTPMQWSADRNAGFSRTNPQRLVLPIIIDPEYHYESVNVEAQQNNPSSLLWWTKRLVALRKRFLAFGRGSIEFLNPENFRVLAFIRQYGDETILVVANLSRFVQFVTLDLSKRKGLVPIELFGGNEFPPIGDAPYMLTLGGHAFYWFSLEPHRSADAEARAAGYQPPNLEVKGSWYNVLHEDESIPLIEAIWAYLESRPWFDGRGRRVQSVKIFEALPVGAPGTQTFIVILRVEYDSGDPERYFIPLAFESGERAVELRARSPQAVLASLVVQGDKGPDPGILLDALSDLSSCQALLEAILRHARIPGAFGEIVASATSALRVPEPEQMDIEPRSLTLRDSNASVLFGDRFFLKLLRRLDEGMSVDLEIGRFLARKGGIEAVPSMAGSIEYTPQRGEPVTLAVLRTYASNEGDAFTRTLEELHRYFDRILSRGRELPTVPLPSRSIFQLAQEEEEVSPEIASVIGSYLDIAKLLGKRTADIHLALAEGGDDPAFAPEPFSTFDQRSIYQTMRNRAGRVLRSLRLGISSLPAEGIADAEALLSRETQVMQIFGEVLSRKLTALKTRHHGDYHLAQVLYTGKDFVVVNFEGDRSRTLSDRRRKGTPLRDVATMLRSAHYAVFTAFFDETIVRREDRAAAEPWAHLWLAWISTAFLRGYFQAAAGATFLPSDPAESEVLLKAYVLKKAFSELGSELEHRSNRVLIPLRGITRLLDAQAKAT